MQHFTWALIVPNTLFPQIFWLAFVRPRPHTDGKYNDVKVCTTVLNENECIFVCALNLIL